MEVSLAHYCTLYCLMTIKLLFLSVTEVIPTWKLQKKYWHLTIITVITKHDYKPNLKFRNEFSERNKGLHKARSYIMRTLEISCRYGL